MARTVSRQICTVLKCNYTTIGRALIPLLASPLVACGGAFDVMLNPEPVQTTSHVKELAVGPAKIGNNEPAAEFVVYSGRYRHRLLQASSVVDPSSSKVEEKKIDDYVDIGITIGKFYCNEFFKQLAIAYAHRQFIRKEVNLVGGLTTAILGVASVNPVVVGLTGTGFAFLDQSIDNFDINFLVSPQIATVQGMVRDAQDSAERDVLRDPIKKPKTFPQAEASLNSYYELCNFNGVKRLVDEAVKEGKPIVRSGDDVNMIAFVEQKRKVAESLGLTILPDALGRALYRVFISSVKWPLDALTKFTSEKEPGKGALEELNEFRKILIDTTKGSRLKRNEALQADNDLGKFFASVELDPEKSSPADRAKLEIALQNMGELADWRDDFERRDEIYRVLIARADEETKQKQAAKPESPQPMLGGVPPAAAAPTALSMPVLNRLPQRPYRNTGGTFSVNIR